MKHRSLEIWVILGVLISVGYILTPALVNGSSNEFFHPIDLKMSTEPEIGFCTYLGGTEQDEVYAITIDNNGSIYLAGSTFSTDFPTTTGAYDRSHNGGPYWNEKDCFVTKLSSDGQEIIYSTFIGGSDNGEYVTAIAVDAERNTYITGRTSSDDFPTTEGAYDTTYNGGETDCFVAKLSADGSELLYSTYLGGSAYDIASDIEVDSSGACYVVGYTKSSDFPINTPNQQEQCHNLGGEQDGFVFKLSDNGSSLEYSMFLGGNGIADIAFALTLDSYERTIIVGVTGSSDFPMVNAFNDSLSGASDSFITRLLSNGRIDFSTYLGGSLQDSAYDVNVDINDDVYIIGSTNGGDFPLVASEDSYFNGTAGVFLSILNKQGVSLEYSGVLRDSYKEGVSTRVGSIMISSIHEIWICGNTGNEQFPVTDNALDKTMSERKGFFVMMDPLRSILNYSTFFGGSNWNSIAGFTMDSSGVIYSCGSTDSADLPVNNAIMPSKLGTEHDVDGFVLNLIPQEDEYILPVLPMLVIGSGIGVILVVIVILKKRG